MTVSEVLREAAIDNRTMRGTFCAIARMIEVVSIWQAATLNSGRRRKALIRSYDCIRLESATSPSIAVRAAAGRTARKRIEEHYQWQKIAEDIERAYLEILGEKIAKAEKKSAAPAAMAGDEGPLRRRAG